MRKQVQGPPVVFRQGNPHFLGFVLAPSTAREDFPAPLVNTRTLPPILKEPPAARSYLVAQAASRRP